MIPSRRTFLHGLVAVPGATLLGRRPLPGLTATVYNGAELHAALRSAGAGSTITLAPGDFGDAGRFVVPARGVMIRAQSPLHTILRDHLVIDGDEAEVEGLAFSEGLTLIGVGQKIVSSKFVNRGVNISGVNTEIGNCEFVNFPGYGITIRGTAAGAYVHHNYFHDSRGEQAIIIGTAMNTSNIRLNARIERNRLEKITGSSEAITVKSSGNRVSNNTLKGCTYLSIRHGENNAISGNTIDGSYGIIVQDRNNQVTGNRCLNMAKFKGIRVMAGNVTPTSTAQGQWPHAENTVVSGNTGYLVVGETWSRFRLPARGTRISNHRGEIALKLQSGTTGAR